MSLNNLPQRFFIVPSDSPLAKNKQNFSDVLSTTANTTVNNSTANASQNNDSTSESPMTATPLRGPARFIPVLGDLRVGDIFKVPFSFPVKRTKNISSPVTLKLPGPDVNIQKVSDNLALPPNTKILTNWVPRLVGKKLYVEGNLLENGQASDLVWKSSKIISGEGSLVYTAKTSYFLQGAMCMDNIDPEMPKHIQYGFKNGFPECWKDFRDGWRLVVQSMSSSRSECSMAVENRTKNLKQNFLHPMVSDNCRHVGKGPSTSLMSSPGKNLGRAQSSVSLASLSSIGSDKSRVVVSKPSAAMISKENLASKQATATAETTAKQAIAAAASKDAIASATTTAKQSRAAAATTTAKQAIAVAATTAKQSRAAATTTAKQSRASTTAKQARASAASAKPSSANCTTKAKAAAETTGLKTKLPEVTSPTVAATATAAPAKSKETSTKPPASKKLPATTRGSSTKPSAPTIHVPDKANPYVKAVDALDCSEQVQTRSRRSLSTSQQDKNPPTSKLQNEVKEPTSKPQTSKRGRKKKTEAHQISDQSQVANQITEEKPVNTGLTSEAKQNKSVEKSTNEQIVAEPNKTKGGKKRGDPKVKRKAEVPKDQPVSKKAAIEATATSEKPTAAAATTGKATTYKATSGKAAAVKSTNTKTTVEKSTSDKTTTVKVASCKKTVEIVTVLKTTQKRRGRPSKNAATFECKSPQLTKDREAERLSQEMFSPSRQGAKPAAEDQKKGKRKSIPCPLTLNPNPKTGADLRRNTILLKELNKNHEDDLFHAAKKPKESTGPSGIEAIRGELFNSDSETDYSIHSARTPLATYFERSTSETSLNLLDAPDAILPENGSESFRQNVYLSRKLNEGRQSQRWKMSTKNVSAKFPAPKQNQNLINTQLSKHLHDFEVLTKKLNKDPDDDTQSDDSEDTMVSLSNPPMGLVELYMAEKQAALKTKIDNHQAVSTVAAQKAPESSVETKKKKYFQ